MSKLNPQRRVELSHKLIVLCDLINENIDQLQADSGLSGEVKEDAGKLIKHCEKFLHDAYKVRSVRSSTYLQELSTKVDTVIRKNYQKML